jgi:hypothetical protein
MKMQSVTSLVISRRMLPQSTPTANSKDVQYNREVGRHNPVQQQQVRIPHILKLHHLPQHAPMSALLFG